MQKISQFAKSLMIFVPIAAADGAPERIQLDVTINNTCPSGCCVPEQIGLQALLVAVPVIVFLIGYFAIRPIYQRSVAEKGGNSLRAGKLGTAMSFLAACLMFPAAVPLVSSCFPSALLPVAIGLVVIGIIYAAVALFSK